MQVGRPGRRSNLPAVSTKVCPNCGAQYVASVERCADCDEPLVDAPDDATAEAAGLGDADPGDQIAYEIGDWTNEARVVLDGMLTRQGIVHVWEAGTLVVRAEDEERTDALVDEVEMTEVPTLDPDADQVVYEITGWDEGQRADLEAALMADEIPHGWDVNGDLVVLEADEERVEPMLDRFDMEGELTADEVAAEPDEPVTANDDDGLAAQDAMSDLFIAADKLMKDATDKDAISRLATASDRTETLGLPYGFSTAVWADLRAKATDLRALVEDQADDDTVIESATALRQMLRQYV